MLQWGGNCLCLRHKFNPNLFCYILSFSFQKTAPVLCVSLSQVFIYPGRIVCLWDSVCWGAFLFKNTNSLLSELSIMHLSFIPRCYFCNESVICVDAASSLGFYLPATSGLLIHLGPMFIYMTNFVWDHFFVQLIVKEHPWCAHFTTFLFCACYCCWCTVVCFGACLNFFFVLNLTLTCFFVSCVVSCLWNL